MPKIDVKNTTIHYEISGQGAPLILIMGLGADHSVWDLHKQAYETHFTCYAIDNRGVGKSESPAGQYTTQQMAQDVLAVMDDANISCAHIAGISMGGAIAQEVCLTAPDRVRSIVLIATWARLPAFNRMVFEHFKQVRSLGHLDIFMQCLQLWIWSAKTFENDTGDLLEAQSMARAETDPQNQQGFAGQCDACITHDTRDRLKQISVPTLITAGDVDIFTPYALAVELSEKIPNAELVTFKNCAHTHHWEDLERFNAITLAFMLEN